ncbi:hypothetical protein FQN57_003509 [Myotisia sp. PD_48]|nr:hypothetical protein FQN57_003509 [Myotisia sp. PD_48]
MKGAFLFTAVAGLMGSALADGIHNKHAHEKFHRRGAPSGHPAPSCTTKTITYYSPAPEEKTTTIQSTSYTTLTVTVSPTDSVPLPTHEVTVYPTPGTYTIDPTTIVVTKETTVCDATSTKVDPGKHTYGGVTTVVTTATTIVCPYATVKPTGNTVTSVIETTTYVCPSAGTYTIAPTTTDVPTSTVIVYPTPATITPGTYVNPGQTVTVTESDYVYVGPQPTGPGEAIPTKQPEIKQPEPKPQPTYPTEPPKQSAPPKNSPPLGGGEKWGMTYSPYTNDSQCKKADAVDKDIGEIKAAGFKTVRIYSSDCGGLETIGNACKKHGLRLILGVFINETGVEGAKSQITDIVKWGQWGIVDLIVVGNEALFAGRTDAGTLAGFIGSAKAAFKAAGYNGPVTTTEPTNVWQQHGKALCGVIDVLGANLHCFFNPDVTAENCGSFVANQMKLLKDICGKEVVNLETGWPNAGNANSKAVPGQSQQAQALASLVKEVGSKSVFFSFSDDAWKQPGPYNVEQHWGCIQNFL